MKNIIEDLIKSLKEQILIPIERILVLMCVVIALIALMFVMWFCVPYWNKIMSGLINFSSYMTRIFKANVLFVIRTPLLGEGLMVVGFLACLMLGMWQLAWLFTVGSLLMAIIYEVRSKSPFPCFNAWKLVGKVTFLVCCPRSKHQYKYRGWGSLSYVKRSLSRIIYALRKSWSFILAFSCIFMAVLSMPSFFDNGCMIRSQLLERADSRFVCDAPTKAVTLSLYSCGKTTCTCSLGGYDYPGMQISEAPAFDSIFCLARDAEEDCQHDMVRYYTRLNVPRTESTTFFDSLVDLPGIRQANLEKKTLREAITRVVKDSDVILLFLCLQRAEASKHETEFIKDLLAEATADMKSIIPIVSRSSGPQYDGVDVGIMLDQVQPEGVRLANSVLWLPYFDNSPWIGVNDGRPKPASEGYNKTVGTAIRESLKDQVELLKANERARLLSMLQGVSFPFSLWRAKHEYMRSVLLSWNVGKTQGFGFHVEGV